jgi:hypothetical protein
MLNSFCSRKQQMLALFSALIKKNFNSQTQLISAVSGITERGPLSLVSTTEELLDRKVEDPF